MPNLPVELIVTVLEYAYYKTPGFHHVDYLTLSNCALVCSSWRNPAQRLLFRSAFLNTRDPFQSKRTFAFYEALESYTGHGEPLGTYVRELEISTPSKIPSLERLWDLPRILSSCPRLYSLTIRTSGLHELDKEVMEKLQCIATGPPGLRIRALNILQFDVQSPLPYQLLSLWPSIQFLRIGSETAAPLPEVPIQANLYELVLHRTPSPPVFEALLASTTSLRILEFRDLPGSQLRPIIATNVPHLRSLRFMLFDMNSAKILRLFPHLEELVVYHVAGINRLTDLPSSLEHFSFRNPAHNFSHTLLHVVDAIKPLQKLRVVTCDPGVLEHSDYPSLRGLCDEKDVELRIDPSHFWIHEDPVVVHSFPRSRSVSNFALMNAAD